MINNQEKNCFTQMLSFIIFTIKLFLHLLNFDNSVLAMVKNALHKVVFLTIQKLKENKNPKNY